MNNSGFWFVWNENGNAPTHKHDYFQLAEKEAERLAKMHRGQTFIVLQSVCALVVNEVQKTDMRPADYVDEIPF